MPLQSCRSEGRPGYRWGKAGKCYTYKPGDSASRAQARKRAYKQGKVIEAGRKRRRR